MINTIHNTLDHYFVFFNTKFKEGKSYYWPSTLKNAYHIFFYYLDKKQFKHIIFDDYTELEQDLDFLPKSAREILEITNQENPSRLPYLSHQEKSEILENFKTHIISSWDINEIFFSCGVYCCIQQLKSQKIPAIHLYFSIYDFLLNNSFSLQFYFFLKQSNVLLQHKKQASTAVITYLSQKCFSIQYDKKKTIKFLENFVLVWDLLEFDLSDYVSLQKQFINEIESNEVQLNPTEANKYSTTYLDINFIKQYISNKTYKT